MADWLPATILGFAFLPFAVGLAAFIIFWVFVTFEPVYRRGYDDYYEYYEYKGSFFWGALGSAFLVWLCYIMMDGFSWLKFKNFLPAFLWFSSIWVLIGLCWALVRWLVEAKRGTRAYDRNREYLVKREHKGDASKLTQMELYELSQTLPTAKKYIWRFFSWTVLWPVSLLDTFFRDLLKIVWEVFYKWVSKALDKMAQAVYGDRYMSTKPVEPEKTYSREVTRL